MTTKNIYITLFIAVFALFSYSCDDSETLESSDIDTMSRFEFPEGSNEWDKIFKDIYEEHGVQIIYKGFTESDLNKSWTGTPGAGTFEWRHYTNPDTLTQLAHYLNDSIFRYLNPEMSRKVFYPYIYIPQGYASLFIHPTTGAILSRTPQVFISEKMDFWLLSVKNEAIFHNESAYQYTFVSTRKRLFAAYLTTAINRGLIVPPSDFKEGMDYTTPIKEGTADVDDENYFLRRGFVNRINLISGSYDRVFTTYTSGAIKLDNLNNGEDFKNYLFALIYEPDMVGRYGIYPNILKRYPKVQDYMKLQYGIDLQAIAKGE